jgi:hypothetical protein
LAALVTALNGAGILGSKSSSTPPLLSAEAQTTSSRPQTQPESANANAPSEFYFIYNYGDGRERGRHDWRRIDQNTWIEKFPNGDENYIKVIGPTTVGGQDGTLLQLARDKAMEYFIPNLGSQPMLLKIRTDGVSWQVLGEMQDIK